MFQRIFSVAILVLTSVVVSAQDLSDLMGTDKPLREPVMATFKASRIINAQTVETAKHGNLFFCITHRFGECATTGAVHTLYGFDNSSDIRFSFDYGLTKNLTLGIGRSKGTNPITELYDGTIKYRVATQTTDNHIPFSVALFGEAGVSARTKVADSSSDAAFPKFVDRWNYVSQLVLARKFNRFVSAELIGSWSHRNFVAFGDENDFFSVGAGARVKLTKRFGITADYFYNLSKFRTDNTDSNGDKVFHNPLAVGVEIETGGHVFTINFTNSTGIEEVEFLPYTRSDWLKGEFRFGFNISRNFVLCQPKID